MYRQPGFRNETTYHQVGQDHATELGSAAEDDFQIDDPEKTADLASAALKFSATGRLSLVP